MPRVSQEYKDDQRAQILEAARRCFIRNGFHRTSVQDVFTESGRSAGAVYRYFPRKDDMIVAVAEQNLADVASVLRAALTGGDGERGLGEVMAELLSAVIRRHQDRQLAAMALMVWSEALRNPALAERLQAAVAGMSGDMAELIRDRQQVGGPTDTSAEALAQVVLSILPGFLFELALLGPSGVASFPDTVRTLWPN
jgi:AcrR family transcriptional regulator